MRSIMRFNIIAGLSFFFMAFTTGTLNAESRIQNSLVEWQDLVQRDEFNVIITNALSHGLPAWPRITPVYASSAMSQEDQKAQVNLRQLATDILHQLELYQSTMHGMDREQLFHACRGLISLRDHLIREPGYVNMVLSDGINRVVFVHLTRQLFVNQDVSEAMRSCVGDLALYECSPVQIQMVIRQELGSFSTGERGGSNVTGDLFVSLIEQFHGPQSFGAFVKEYANAGLYQLIEKRDIFLLLWRYAFTDTRIRLMLPLAHEAMNQLDESDRHDLSALRMSVKSLDASEHQSVGAPLLGLRTSEEAVMALVRVFKAHRLQQFLQFDTSPLGLQKRRVEDAATAIASQTADEVCLANRQMLHWARAQAAVVHHKPKSHQLDIEHLRPYLRERMVPVCPAGGSYSIGDQDVPIKCSVHGAGIARRE